MPSKQQQDTSKPDLDLDVEKLNCDTPEQYDEIFQKYNTFFLKISADLTQMNEDRKKSMEIMKAVNKKFRALTGDAVEVADMSDVDLEDPMDTDVELDEEQLPMKITEIKKTEDPKKEEKPKKAAAPKKAKEDKEEKPKKAPAKKKVETKPEEKKADPKPEEKKADSKPDEKKAEDTKPEEKKPEDTTKPKKAPAKKAAPKKKSEN
jgi:hypothetical protein